MDDLLEECEWLAIQALCGANDMVEGRHRWVMFEQRWPHSNHARELSEACRR